MKEVLTALETLEESEQIKQQIEKMKGKENRHNGNRNRDNGNSRGGGNGKCRKQGHDHLWKDCPDNPRNKNNHERGRSRDNNQIERTQDDSGDRKANREHNPTVCWADEECNFIRRVDSDSMPDLE